MDVTSLSVSVTSKGITDATKSLDAFVKSAGAAAGANEKLAKSSDVQEKANKSAVASAEKEAAKLARSLQAQADAYAKAQGRAMDMNKAMDNSSYAKAQAEALKMNKAIDAQAASMQNAHERGSVLNNTIKSMIVAMVAYASLNFAKTIIADSDACLGAGLEIDLAVDFLGFFSSFIICNQCFFRFLTS